MLKEANVEFTNVQKFITDFKEEAKAIIKKSDDSYLLEITLEPSQSKAPSNKKEISDYLDKVTKFSIKFKNECLNYLELPISDENKLLVKRNLILMTAFTGHVRYLFNFQAKRKTYEEICEEIFENFSKLYQANVTYIKGDNEAVFYTFLMLYHNINYCSKQLILLKNKQSDDKLKGALALLELFIENSNNPNLIIQACILASTTRTSEDIAIAYNRPGNVCDFKRALSYCKKAESILSADASSNPLIHIVNAQKFIVSYKEWTNNLILNESKCKTAKKIYIKRNKNIVDHQEEMLLLQSQDEVANILNKINNDPKKIQLYVKFICELFKENKIVEGFTYCATNKFAEEPNELNDLEAYFLRGTTIESARIIYRLLQIQKNVIKYSCEIFEKAIIHYNHSALIKEPLFEKGEEYLVLLRNWQASLIQKNDIEFTDCKNDTLLATINKKLDELLSAREAAKTKFKEDQARADQIFNELIAEFEAKEQELEAEYKKKQEELIKVRKIPADNIEKQEESNEEESIQIHSEKKPPSYEHYQNGEKAFHNAQKTHIYVEKETYYQEAIRCFAAMVNIASVHSDPNYELIVKSQSFIADCNMGLANLSYHNKAFIDSIDFRSLAIEENLSQAMKVIHNWEKQNPNPIALKLVKESVIAQLQAFKLDAIAHQALINAKLAVREEGRKQAMIRLGAAWFKNKHCDTISYFATELQELRKAANKVVHIAEKLESLYPQSQSEGKVSQSIVAMLDNSKVSSIFRNKGNEAPIGADEEACIKANEI